MKNSISKKRLPQKPGSISINFANTVLVLGFLISLIIVFFSLYRYNYLIIPTKKSFYIVIIIFFVTLAFLFLFSLRLSYQLKVNLSVFLFTFTISVYFFEFFLAYLNLQRDRSAETIAKNTNIEFDYRTKMEVIDDIRKDGIEVYPNILPSFFLKKQLYLKEKKELLFPLGMISNTSTILNNELGFYPIIKTDEFGFNNNSSNYLKKRIDIILTGDSFTEGYSVNADDNIGSVLREFGYNSISVGKGSNSSLIELAAVKEYAEPLKPKIVLWLYWNNDLRDLKGEMESEYLKQYLDNVDFSQNLISRQDEIDKSLIEYVNEKWEVQRVKFNEGDRNRELEKWNYLKINIINIIKLTNLRLRAGMTPSTKKNHAQEDNLKDFKKIINTAKKMVANWNGKFYFLEIPSHSKVKGKIAEDQFSYDVLQIVKELDIPIIDLYSMGFKGKKEVDSLYSRKHFTAKGYRLVAETIAKRLKSDGFLPSKD